MRIKKITPFLCTAAVLALSSSVKADSAPPPSSSPQLFKSGAYTGASFGYSYQNASVQELLNIPPSPATAPQKTVHSNGVTGDIFLGYRRGVGNGFMVGAELTGALNSNEISQPITATFAAAPVTSQTILTSNGQLIPAVVLGKQIDPRWLVFLKGGANINFFRFLHYVTNTGPLGSQTGTYSKTSTGFMLGAGAEYAVSERASLAGTVSYLGSGNFKQNYPNITTVTRVADAAASTQFKNVYYVTAKASLIYKF